MAGSMNDEQIERFYDGFIRAQYMTDEEIDRELERTGTVSRPNFTPGPWKVNTSTHHDSGKPWTIWTSRGPGCGAVAHLAPWCPPGTSREEEQKIADAHLISAAPDLYDALDRIVHNCRDADCGDHCSNSCMFCQARSALDKAIGKGKVS
jgi:hypothetical protein